MVWTTSLSIQTRLSTSCEDPKIVNVFIGAQRVLTLRTKKDSTPLEGECEGENFTGSGRCTQHVPLRHNSMFVMGLETNAWWLHSIRTDKRPRTEKTDAELAQDDERISLTFSHIGTFLSSNQSRIWGQGARGKTRDDAQRVNRGGGEAQELIEAFGEENHRSEFVWDWHYARGFDVVHFAVQEE